MSTNEKENLEETNNPVSHNKSGLVNSKSKRPAQILYIPKHMRNEETTLLTNTTNSTNNGDACSNTNGTSSNRCNSPISDPSIIGYITDSSKQFNYENLILDKLKTLNISNAASNNVIQLLPSPSEQKTQLESDDWFSNSETLLTDNQLPTKQAETYKVIDYLKFEPLHPDINLDEEEYGHILEIYEFPAEFKNENIYSALNEIIGHINFDLKWVDDTHCLGVFESVAIARSALNQNTNIFMKMRTLSSSGPESKRRAQRLVSYMRPYKPRPQTTSFVASRLIGASLGLNGMIPKERLKEERKKIDSARDSKKKDREIREAVWEGK